MKLKFVLKKKHTLAVSGPIIFYFKMNLIFVEAFFEKYIYFAIKKNKTTTTKKHKEKKKLLNFSSKYYGNARPPYMSNKRLISHIQ